MCPFCLCEILSPSWLTVIYKNKSFPYLKCSDCRSLICSPMPDAETLLEMYGTNYEDELRAPTWDSVLKHLSDGGGVFLDYGCGDGSLLPLVAERGYTPIGIEFNPDTVARLREKHAFTIALPAEATEPADVLHLGDLIEHLTDIDSQLPEILARLKPGGILIAHNPLEGNPNLFTLVMKWSRVLRGAFYGVPYHVTLATTKGQKALFERMGLEAVSFSVEEIDFPAPSRPQDFRGLMLLSLRKVSQLASQIVGIQKTGNRYLFIGRKRASATHA